MKTRALLAVVSAFWLSILLLSAPAASAVSGDEHWDPAFGWPGQTNYVYSVAQHNGVLYCGGQPPNSGTNTILYSWDGVQWSQVAVFGSSGPIVYDLAFVGNTLYAVGNFTNVNGVPIKGLAQRNGSTWSDVGGFNGFAYALAVSGNNLYVGGRYTNGIGSVTATNIGYWDGAAWHALGNGLGKNGETVDALLLTNGLIYAGGAFTNSGSQIVTNLAVWNGSTWAAVGATLNGQVMSLAMLGTDLYAAGFFSKAGATTANYIAKWNGTTWSALGSGLAGGIGVESLTVFGNRLCVGGYFLSAGGFAATNFAVWDGASWQIPVTNMTGSGSSAIFRVATIGNTLYMGGLFATINGLFVNQFAAWDGTTWTPVGNPAQMNGLSSLTARALATDGVNVYAAGTFGYAGQVFVSRIARWDGTSWHALGSGLNGTANALAVVGTDLYVGGSFTTAGGISATHLARWDGANWYAVPGFPSSGTINSLAAYGSDLLVGGNYQISAVDRLATGIARWDGANWWSFGGFFFVETIGGIGVAAINVNGSDVYLAGNFQASNFSSGATSTNVVRFDGSDWQPMAGGVNSNALALAVIGSDVYVGGSFTSASGVSANRIARWDGSGWHSVGTGVTGTGSFSVSSLAAMGNNLYAAGSFTNASGLNVNRIAEWDGSTWSALGSGITYPAVGTASISALTTRGSDLFVGGTFGASGGKPAYFFARWNDTYNFDQPPMIQLGKLLRAPGFFKLAVTTTNVVSYVIEASTDFSTWTPVDTNTASFYEFWDFDAPNYPKRFYRARSGP